MNLSLIGTAFLLALWVPSAFAQFPSPTLLVKGTETEVLHVLKEFPSQARIVKSFPQIGWVTVESKDEETFVELKSLLQRNKSTQKSEENLTWHQIAFPNDKKYSRQKNEISRTEIESAWNVTTGSAGTLIAVIDSGIDAKHPDIKNRLWQNPGEFSNGIDDDQNGLVDDIYGWDFVNSDNNPEDGSDHGTHVAGIIGAEGNNLTGITGVNWDCRIIALRTLDDRGSGSTDKAVEAILYAVSKGARVINASWGGYAHSQALQDALQYATDHGILVVAAAGNNQLNTDQEPFYPASYPVNGVLAVGSSESQGRMSSFSNYGRFSVDVIAPGSNIYSTTKGGGYDRKNGTSMAAPFVSGIAGLILSLDPSLTTHHLKNAVMNATTPHSLFQGRASTGGEVNVRAAVQQINSSFQIWPQRASIRVNDQILLSAYAANSNVTWSVSDPRLAQVDASGKLLGLAPGTVLVTGTSGQITQTSQITIGEPNSGGCNKSSQNTITIQAAAPLGLIFGCPFVILLELRTRVRTRLKKLLTRRNSLF